ncbi:hypothetical protein VHEMI09343 [[Torrubiella] hemipterigena]|uniref:Uncharacterized protein n=1 Tax=[Torrubiella] hemipterigena TaxID=1531966 RepID=A0A0A1TG55_9HYPO|nr:hypothetical protein VHEMI09343 [[Torrubiella] hemipterigena]
MKGQFAIIAMAAVASASGTNTKAMAPLESLQPLCQQRERLHSVHVYQWRAPALQQRRRRGQPRQHLQQKVVHQASHLRPQPVLELKAKKMKKFFGASDRKTRMMVSENFKKIANECGMPHRGYLEIACNNDKFCGGDENGFGMWKFKIDKKTNAATALICPATLAVTNYKDMHCKKNKTWSSASLFGALAGATPQVADLKWDSDNKAKKVSSYWMALEKLKCHKLKETGKGWQTAQEGDEGEDENDNDNDSEGGEDGEENDLLARYFLVPRTGQQLSL